MEDSYLTSNGPFSTGKIMDPENFFGDIKKALEQGKLLNVISEFRKMKERLSRASVSIAVTGDTGNGMSSFINALRVVGHEQEDSAPTGVVRTTQRPTCYSSSSFPYVELWDLPGLGATAQSVESYLEEVKGSQYDLFIIIASEQFSSNHVQLAKAIQRMGKKFYVVWTKVDRDFNTSALSESQLRQNVQKNILENLQKEWVKGPPIFLVCNFDPFSYEFTDLRNVLQNDIFNIRYNPSLETLYCICDKSIEARAFYMKDRELTQYLQGALPTGDAEDLQGCLETYQNLFGVDDASLQQVAQSVRFGEDVMKYRADMKSQNFRIACQRDLGLRLLMCVAVKKFLGFLGCWFWYGLFNWVISGFQHLRRRRIIEVIAQDTKIILRKILEDYMSFL
ncbi:immunity-related GTPase family M protein 1-like [Nannospalax galili]|nr:immunity-related GTPase family M protein 1-like [Nannospalax galili]XP_017655896.1 immunity-related GTPase family M protein 1-like [Nannospalax galili]XP_029423790.1 immunity-related GTPase family M protein 1-like [Nannospalax galili]